MDKTRLTIAFVLPYLTALLLYPEPTDFPLQTPKAPLSRHGGNLHDRPIPYRIADRPNPEADREIAALFAPKRHPPLIADRPPELDPYKQSQASKPKIGSKHAAKPKSPVIIQIDQTHQRLSVHVGGEAVEGLESVLVSTGLPGKATKTPDGTYSPRALAVRRPSYFATRLLNRPVYLTHAIQIVDGIFMHDASDGAMAHLGKKRSHGCVRVDRRQMPKIFRLVKRHRTNTRIQIFHSSIKDAIRGDPSIAARSEIEDTR